MTEKVQLDENGYPTAYGVGIDGQDIPTPPDPMDGKRRKWTGDSWQQVDDPDSIDPDSIDPSNLGNDELVRAVEAGEIDTRKVLVYLLKTSASGGA